MSLPVGCCAATVAYASGACSCALDVFAAASMFQGSGALAGGYLGARTPSTDVESTNRVRVSA